MLLCYQKHSVLIDGIFGSGTMAAVKAYQTLRNLTSDGIVGENTWASLCIATPPDGRRSVLWYRRWQYWRKWQYKPTVREIPGQQFTR